MSSCLPCPVKGQVTDRQEEVLNVTPLPCWFRIGEELCELANEQIVWAAVFRPPVAVLMRAVPGRSRSNCYPPPSGERQLNI